MRTRKRNAGSPLDIIIEAAVRLSVLLQQLKGVVIGKILKLHHRVRLPLLQGHHKPLYDSPVCWTHKPALPEALQDKSGSYRSTSLPEGELVHRFANSQGVLSAQVMPHRTSCRATPRP